MNTPLTAEDFGLAINDIRVVDKDGNELFWITNPAYAAFIVEACNKYEKLVELLNLTLNRSDGLVYLHHINPKCGEGGTEICPDCLNDKIRATLAELKG